MIQLLKLPKTFISYLHILKIGYLHHGVDLEVLIPHVQIILVIIIIVIIFTLVISTLGEIKFEADWRVLFQCVDI